LFILYGGEGGGGCREVGRELVGGRERMAVDDYTNYLLRTAILEDTENFNVILRSLDC